MPSPKRPKPRYKKGQKLRTLIYLSPLPRGATVAVLQVEEDQEELGLFRYLIEGQARGRTVEIWTSERDLDLPFTD
jgi:hypothetical protein